MFKEGVAKLRKKRVRDVKEKLKEEIKEAEEKGDRDRLKDLISKYAKINAGGRNG